MNTETNYKELYDQIMVEYDQGIIRLLENFDTGKFSKEELQIQKNQIENDKNVKWKNIPADILYKFVLESVINHLETEDIEGSDEAIKILKNKLSSCLIEH